MEVAAKASRLDAESVRGSDADGSDGALLAQGLEPGTVVELDVVLLDETIVVDHHVVDADDWVGADLGDGGDLVAPGDVLAVVEDVEGVDLDLRLELALAHIESLLIREGDRAERLAGHEVDRVGDVDEVHSQGLVGDSLVVATADWATAGSVVGGELQQVDEVGDNGLSIVIGQALAVVRLASGPRTLVGLGDGNGLGSSCLGDGGHIQSALATSRGILGQLVGLAAVGDAGGDLGGDHGDVVFPGRGRGDGGGGLLRRVLVLPSAGSGQSKACKRQEAEILHYDRGGLRL
jgi:hypothetical protein